jgi:hypothetical protein
LYYTATPYDKNDAKTHKDTIVILKSQWIISTKGSKGNQGCPTMNSVVLSFYSEDIKQRSERKVKKKKDIKLKFNAKFEGYYQFRILNRFGKKYFI